MAHLDERVRRVLLIVPEQYTLQAERNAFAYLNAPGFIDFEVLSMTSLGRRILSETGGGNQSFVNKYGKFMLISGLLHKNKQSLMTFRNLEGSADFVGKLNDMIAELKNFNISATELKDIADGIEGDSLLKRKLADVATIYAGYEDRTKEEYLDTADYLKLFTSKIAKSDFIAETEVWLSAFDYLTPAALDTLTELILRAPSVNLVLTAAPDNSFFQLTNALMSEVEKRAAEAGAKTKRQLIGDSYAYQRPGVIAHIEKALFSYPIRLYEGNEPALRLVSAANYYTEAETAAARIAELIRDEGLRYRDILVLCNDMDARAPVIRRVFARYGLPIFVDQRRSIEHNPVLEYILALLSIVAGGWFYDAIFQFLKTGLTDIGRDTWEELENYVCNYRIRGSLWKRDFTYGLTEYAQEEMDALNETRRKIASLIGAFEEPFRQSATVRQRTECLYRFLTDTAKLPEAIDALAATLENTGESRYAEYAAEMAGTWDVVTDIFEQLFAALGELPVSPEEYADVLRTGFASVRMGMLPPLMDQIVLGTMQRTRSGGVQAIFVLGANDGVLPMTGTDDAILNEDEKAQLSDAGYDVGKACDKILMEEQLAIYRNLSKPQRLLHVSYSVSDGGGRDIKPSMIFERLRRLFPNVPVEKDIINDGGDPLRLIQYRDEARGHLTENLQRWIGGELLPAVWKDVYLWFKEDGRDNGSDDMVNIRAGLTFRNRRERIDERFVEELYGGARDAGIGDAGVAEANCDGANAALITSPSALERFSRCPFAFFMDRGVRLKERRVFEIDSRNVGDVYHEVLMRYGMEMIRDGLPAADERSAWRTINEAESAALTRRIYDEVSSEYKEGLFHGGGYERYKSDRIKRITADVAWILTEQVRAGAITDMRFEAGFGDGEAFPAIEVAREGKLVRVKGRIDRIDVLEGGYAKIIDYKSGADAFSRDDVLGGWQLQLMLYLMAVREQYKPAGVFYFKIAEPRAEDTGTGDIAKEIMKGFKLDGIAINDPQIAAAIGQKVRSVEPADFAAIQDSVSSLVTGLCGKLLSGNIDARPMIAKKLKAGNRPMSACTYCSYRGICNFDRVFG
ncbi:MAG: exodeoxyribonuclease V subunit gamma [Clostridiales Family XIII bacterium]|nr:exodeoxyribonuclease V subunit gamma [Clostridiales Family XIII bacterium]